MPTLNWIGKEAVLEHHKSVPLRLLECDRELSAGDPDAGNLLVQGDNLEALKALLPRYKGQVKCIYIDPPYNTGNEGWIYNDNVNDPRIKKWLGEVVGKEAEDLCRHDKWLCMMYPRLALLTQFLTEDGVILVSLDDTEVPYLRLILDELLGKSAFVASIVWNTRNTDNRVKTLLSPDHEYIVVYGKRAGASILGRVIDRSDFRNPDNDPRGPYVTDPLTGKATAEERPNLHAYNMEQPGTENVWRPDPAKGWITDEDGYKRLLADNRIWWPPNPQTGKPRKKRFLSEAAERMPASTFWPEFRAMSGAAELDAILVDRVFAFPKPISVIQRVIDYCAPKNAFVLDSFAGTGTTAHAVLQMNIGDGGRRRFICIEMDAAIAENVTAKRLRKVVQGYDAEGNRVEPLGSGFRFCRLGKTLFDKHGEINEEVPFTDLARYVYLIETGMPAPTRPRCDNPLLGVHEGRAVYLLYNGVLGDRRPAGGNVLTHAVLDALPPHPTGTESPRVIYGEACRLSEATLQRLNVTFRQTPYALREG
jgi:adenine-specific DNA-methyltransferase